MTDFITELRERRVLPAIGVYVASCWLIVEILDRLVERYLLSPYLTDIVFWGLFSLIPAVSLIAWSYGRPGKDSATTAQKVGVPINILATAGLLLTVFGGKELGVTADVITMANEDGVEETHVVPKDSFRRRLAIFFYSNDSGDPELDWLQYASTEMLTQDLQQDPYLIVDSPYSGGGAGYYGRMKAAGYDDALGLPVSLMRDIARDANRQYFAEGSLQQQGDEYIVTTRLWETEGMQQLEEIQVRGWDLYALLDDTSRQVRKTLEVPSIDVRGHEDLPLAETYGESEDALKFYIEGINTKLLANDIPTAIAQFDQALEVDPGFVLAHFVKAFSLVEAGDMPSAAQSLAAAQQFEFRLPARDRATLKTLYYRTTGQTEKLIEFLRLQTQLLDDARTHSQLGGMLMYAGDTQGAKFHLKEALKRDSLDTNLLLLLSILERSTDNMAGAIDYAEQYQTARPDDMNANLQLGDLLRDSGELDQAESHYSRAGLIESDAVEPSLRLADIAIRRGDEQQARAYLEEADRMAKTAAQRALLHQAASQLENRLGRVNAAIEQMRAAEPHLAATQPPFAVLLAVHLPISGYNIRRNDPESAQRILSEAAQILAPPLDQFLAAGEATLLAYQKDFAGAEAALQRFETVLEQLKFDALMFQVDLIAATIDWNQEDYEGARDHLLSSVAAIDSSFIAAQMNGYAMAEILSTLADSQVRSGDSDGAERTLERGFKIDPSHPGLWVAKARMQYANGQAQLARVSIDYALAIWANADDDVEDIVHAQELAAEIAAGI